MGVLGKEPVSLNEHRLRMDLFFFISGVLSLAGEVMPPAFILAGRSSGRRRHGWKLLGQRELAEMDQVQPRSGKRFSVVAGVSPGVEGGVSRPGKGLRSLS